MNHAFNRITAWHAPHFPFHAPAENRKPILDDLAPTYDLPTELSALNETRDSIEQKLDGISTLVPFLLSQQHILGDAFNVHGKFKARLKNYLKKFQLTSGVKGN